MEFLVRLGWGVGGNKPGCQARARVWRSSSKEVREAMAGGLNNWMIGGFVCLLLAYRPVSSKTKDWDWVAVRGRAGWR